MLVKSPIAISAFHDNYIWAIVHPIRQSFWVVDPGCDQSVIEFANKCSLALEGILITHHHRDHQGGVQALLERWPVPVFVPKNGQCEGTCEVEEGQEFSLFDGLVTFTVLRVPGHTLDHIAYYGHGWLFCGDCVFSAGCGRVFEGSYAPNVGIDS